MKESTMSKPGIKKGTAKRRRIDPARREPLFLRGLYEIERACDAFFDSRQMPRGRGENSQLFAKQSFRGRKAKQDQFDKIAAAMGQA